MIAGKVLYRLPTPQKRKQKQKKIKPGKELHVSDRAETMGQCDSEKPKNAFLSGPMALTVQQGPAGPVVSCQSCNQCVLVLE